jgi:hypothetical protein
MYNLCDLIDKSNVFHNFVYRFCPKTYHNTDDDDVGRRKLEQSLVQAAKRSGGLELVVASGIGKVEQTGARRAFVLQCDCSISYKPSSTDKYDKENHTVNPNDIPYRRQSLHNDGINKRPAKQGGKQANHRRCTKRVLNRQREGPCKFRLPVYVDNIGFFLKGRVGYNRHLNQNTTHPKPCLEFAALANSTRHLPEEQRKCLESVAQARAGATVAANVLFAAFGTHVSVKSKA